MTTRYDPKRGGRVPLARTELLRIAANLRKLERMPDTAKWIEDIVYELMIRNSPAKPVSRTKSKEVTVEVIRDMAYWYAKDPNASTDTIGALCGVNGGRVSEWLQRQRTEEHPGGTPEWRQEKAKL